MSTGAWWEMVLAIAVGSFVGALLRQGLVVLFARSSDSLSGVMLATSSVLGGLFGAAMGGVMATATFTPKTQMALFIALTAALGTFGVGAVLAIQPPSRKADPRVWRTAAIHLALAILGAVVGMILIQWLFGLEAAHA